MVLPLTADTLGVNWKLFINDLTCQRAVANTSRHEISDLFLLEHMWAKKQSVTFFSCQHHALVDFLLWVSLFFLSFSSSCDRHNQPKLTQDKNETTAGSSCLWLGLYLSQPDQPRPCLSGRLAGWLAVCPPIRHSGYIYLYLLHCVRPIGLSWC